MAKQKWFHAIGICGKTTSNVTLMFRKMGWYVTGSDSQYFPPVSTMLEKENVPTAEGYHFSHLTKEFWIEKLGIKPEDWNTSEVPDLCLIVESVTSKNKEYLFAKKRGIDVRPYAQILNGYLIKPESIVVIGTAGKTTTTALITKIFQELHLNPSYMVAAEVVDIPDSLQNTDSNWSVMEGDEYYSLELSTGAKFLQYKPKYLVITNIGWEHQDVYPSQERYIEEFKKCVELVPEDGVVIAKAGDKNIDEVVKAAKCKVIRYSADGGNGAWRVEKDTVNKVFDDKNEMVMQFKTNLIGDYNLENVLAATILLKFLDENGRLKNIDFDFEIPRIVAAFKGPKKRLEMLYKSDKLMIIDVFGVAPSRSKNSLRTLRQYNPDKNAKLIAVFEPNSGSRPKDEALFNEMYKDAFKDANEVVIPDLSAGVADLATTEEVVSRLKSLGFNAHHIASGDLERYLTEVVKDIRQPLMVVFFSSYRLTEAAERLASEAKSLANG